MLCAIKNYSVYDNYTTVSMGANISDVLDRLLRVTTKLTESYASDICYLIPTLLDENREGNLKSRLIFFREGGVSWTKLDDSGEEIELTSGMAETGWLQVWSLTPKGEDLILRRVYLTGKTNDKIIGL